MRNHLECREKPHEGVHHHGCISLCGFFDEEGGVIMVRINGKDEAAAGMVLQEYLEQQQYPKDGIAVECNERMLPKSAYGSYVLKDGDVVEIVSFVGGG